MILLRQGRFLGNAFVENWLFEKKRHISVSKLHDEYTICDPASQNQQKVAWPSFVLWLEIGDQGQHG